MVRPLIRLSLGKRQPMRRWCRPARCRRSPGARPYRLPARTADAGPDTGEYLVQALGAGRVVHLLATLAEANCLVVVPAEVDQVRTGEIVDVAFLAQRG